MAQAVGVDVTKHVCVSTCVCVYVDACLLVHWRRKRGGGGGGGRGGGGGGGKVFI